jgi:L,D-peptidoglycan transpeptidase YkuD (ErfK/YbiS/YcfS/YnhG family)
MIIRGSNLRQKSSKIIRVLHLSSKSVLLVKGVQFDCQIGRAGFKRDKREGDGATPLHAMRFREVYYRADRVKRPQTRLKTRKINPGMGWEERVDHPRYNRFTPHPHKTSEEHLMRDDHLYDIVIVLGWNDAPIRKGRGSAIFLHLSRAKPTAGCVAVSLHTMQYVLKTVSRETVLIPKK